MGELKNVIKNVVKIKKPPIDASLLTSQLGHPILGMACKIDPCSKFTIILISTKTPEIMT
jgi:hypothetical protein